MRGIFSLVGLLVVVVLVLMLGRNQLKALGFGGPSAAVPAAASTRGAAPATVPEQVHSMQHKAQADVQRTLEAGMQQRASEPGQ